MSLSHTLRREFYFGLQRLLGSRAGARYRALRRQERWPQERFAAWRSATLARVLDHARAEVPFYREVPGSALDLFPVIGKTDLAAHFNELMTPALRAQVQAGRKSAGYGWIKVTSGGTTGVPTTVIHDADFRDANRAARVYEFDLCGFPFGTPHYRLWGSMADLQRARASIVQRVTAIVAGERLLNAFRLDDEASAGYLRQMRSGGIEHMVAYVDAADHLARFAQRHGVAAPRMRSIMSAAGTLTDEVRARLQDVFGARVFNKYGSRDCGEMACECEAGGLHVLAPLVCVEILDDHHRPVPAGVTGNIVVTSLVNRLFPLIRFANGDLGAWSPRHCTCGRPFPLLERIDGRTTDFLVSTSGGYVSPVAVRHIVGVVHGRQKLQRFQLIQESASDFRLLLQPATGESRTDIEALRPGLAADLGALLGSGARIDIQVVDDIPPAASGKQVYTINRTKRIP